MSAMQEKAPPLSTLKALHLWHDVMLSAMKDLDFDLSARQAGLIMHVYLRAGPHTVRSLAEALGMSKAAVCRAVDTLSMAKLIKRKKDESDKRNVFIQRTVHGSVFLSDFADIIMKYAEPAGVDVGVIDDVQALADVGEAKHHDGVAA
jgi:DNA-binding MarR family transcriptional regulator